MISVHTVRLEGTPELPHNGVDAEVLALSQVLFPYLSPSASMCSGSSVEAKQFFKRYYLREILPTGDIRKKHFDCMLQHLFNHVIQLMFKLFH